MWSSGNGITIRTTSEVTIYVQQAKRKMISGIL